MPKRKKKKRITPAQMAGILAGVAVVLVGIIALMLHSRPASGPYDYEGMQAPATFVPSQLEALFAAEKTTGIPLEALAALAQARGLSLDQGETVADAFTTETDPDLSPAENARRLAEGLPEGEEKEQALEYLDSLTWLGEIRRGKIYPLPMDVRNDYEDGWGDARPGDDGARPHEGVDIFVEYGTPGYSVCSGTVEKKGWLQLGGWRLGIRGDDGIYYYYAHMSSYADVEVGDRVEAGTVIGYVGDTGYGPEGTTGQFPAHLHFGMYQGQDDTELAFNPYPFLIQWEAETPAA